VQIIIIIIIINIQRELSGGACGALNDRDCCINTIRETFTSKKLFPSLKVRLRVRVRVLEEIDMANPNPNHNPILILILI
jgi:hypothetical protein